MKFSRKKHLINDDNTFVTSHPNTELCVDLKLFTRQSGPMVEHATLTGILTRDSEDHFTFRQTHLSSSGKRNPRVFDGNTITVTMRDNGSLRPNFKPLHISPDFNPSSYATQVANELLAALSYLLGN